ncbi:glycosyltransferase family 4 protein [Candidatus Saccharibacteria bacterium]|nr:glycosyltransferase family 4 protein [Candidatus Saccharibacteria bacterium]
MRIVFNLGVFRRGGAERVITNLSNGLADDNEVYIMITGIVDDPYVVNDKVKMLDLDEGGYLCNPIVRNARRIRKMKKMLLAIQPDVVVSFLPSPSYRVLFLKKKINCKVIVSDRNDPRHEYKSLINRILCKWLYKRADGFVFQTNEQKNFFSKAIQEHSVVIPNPLKSEFLNSAVDERKKNTIISVGRFHKQKNQRLLIDAFYEISLKYKNYKLKIFGHGPLEKELSDYIKRLGMVDKIMIHKPVEDIKKELSESRIFVMTSDYEGMPNALMEAMACGLPCISTDCPCGGPRELIKDGVNGILFGVGDKNQLIAKLEVLIEDDGLRKKLGREAKKICDKMNPEEICKRWKKYITEIVNGKN